MYLKIGWANLKKMNFFILNKNCLTISTKAFITRKDYSGTSIIRGNDGEGATRINENHG